MKKQLLFIAAMFLVGWRLSFLSIAPAMRQSFPVATFPTPTASTPVRAATTSPVTHESTPADAAIVSAKRSAVLLPADEPPPSDEDLEAVAELIRQVDEQQNGLQGIFEDMQNALRDFQDEVQP